MTPQARQQRSARPTGSSVKYASPHFTAVPLTDAYNTTRGHLPNTLLTPPGFDETFGHQVIKGIPFQFGERENANVVLLEKETVAIPLRSIQATYLLFVHVEEYSPEEQAKPRSFHPGGPVGTIVSEYELEYQDGETVSVPILRRLAIQSARSPAGLACLPAGDDKAVLTLDESVALGRLPTPAQPATSTRVWTSPGDAFDGTLWIYALSNPRPETPISVLKCRPRGPRSAIYALSYTDIDAHPLRFGVRQKLRTSIPPAVAVNDIGEIDQSAIGIDLGLVISARAALDYDPERWTSDAPHVEPRQAEREVLIEYVAHPQARLYLGDQVHDLVDLGSVHVSPAQRPVRLCFIDKRTRDDVAVRLHIHGEAGEYLPPRGHHRKVDRAWNEDRSGELATEFNQYAYIDGCCTVDLPIGDIYIEITRGYEIAPLRTMISVTPQTNELIFELDRVLRWRERGWASADTHVHFLTPQAALLEGRAEDVNVVNLLASQWGELFTGVADFDGKTTFGANSDTGIGEHLVRLGSENRTTVLGHISLLGYRGELIQPLCTGGPAASAFGDPLLVTLADWARQCRAQQGLVVLPHAQLRAIEHSADVALGLIDAVEVMNFNPLMACPGNIEMGGLDPFALASWYRYLNVGSALPLVAGSDKMSAEMLLGGIRTYAYLGERALTYEHWIEAIRAGNTFVTIGPLVEFSIEGQCPGSSLALPRGGGTLQVQWNVESVNVPVDAVEILVGGVAAHEAKIGGALSSSGEAEIRVTSSTWAALRVRGSYHGRSDDIAAHTSAIQLFVDGEPILSPFDAAELLDEIRGTLAYIDTIAPHASRREYLDLRSRLTDAYNRFH